jgi:hypothetical protein
LRQIIIFYCHFNTKETLKQDDVAPLEDVLALEQIVGEKMEVVGAL